jgi:hypothetical protein
MSKTLTLLHTSPVHVETFNRLLNEIAPDIPVKHIVKEDLLQEARQSGADASALKQHVSDTIFEAIDQQAGVVLCTCSTIGTCAELAGQSTETPVLRVDKPMAQKAVMIGSPIVVAATLKSTVQPTRELILTTAQELGRIVTIQEVICESAWDKFEQGDLDSSYQEIANTLRPHSTGAQVIVLAQASMAGAVAYCSDFPIPVLSSPRLGIEAAIEVYRGDAR